MCSETTKRLVTQLGVHEEFIDSIELNKPWRIEPPSFTGFSPFTITLIDANHCPGSVAVIVRGVGFAYFVSGDIRVSCEVLRIAKTLGPTSYDVGFLDSTFYDSSGKWDVMPTIGQSISALVTFLKSNSMNCAFEFDLLGTEVLIEAVLDAFPKEKIAVTDGNRYDELITVFSTDRKTVSRLIHLEIEDSPWRFAIISRSTSIPPNFMKLRASTQRWAGHIRRSSTDGTTFPLIEVCEQRNEAFLFFSFHSCKKEIDWLIRELNIKEWRPLVPAIEVDHPKPIELPSEPSEKPRRKRCMRRPFDFTTDGMWLATITDSQETVMASSKYSDDDVILPTWRNL